MFSKSKKIPDGSYRYINLPFGTEQLILVPPPVYFSTGKDYLPIEHEPILEDSTRYRKNSFISQTKVFEGLEFIPSISERHKNDSSVSLSSTTTSSTRTSSDEFFRSSTTRKLSATESVTVIQQKEIESLQIRIKHMESTIKLLEEQNYYKDLELDELKNKHHLLTKSTINQNDHLKKIKEVEYLRKLLVINQRGHESELKERDHTITVLKQKIERHDYMLCDLQRQNQAQLETQTAQFTNELTGLRLTKDKEISQLQSQLEKLQESQDGHQTELSRLTQQNHTLHVHLETHKKTVNQLQSRLKSNEAEINTLVTYVDQKDSCLKEQAHQIEQWKAYREYVQHTMIPHLRNKWLEQDAFQIEEFNTLSRELFQARQFINQQARYMTELKSTIFWLTLQNVQIQSIILDLAQESRDYIQFVKSFLVRYFQSKSQSRVVKKRWTNTVHPIKSSVSNSIVPSRSSLR